MHEAAEQFPWKKNTKPANKRPQNQTNWEHCDPALSVASVITTFTSTTKLFNNTHTLWKNHDKTMKQVLLCLSTYLRVLARQTHVPSFDTFPFQTNDHQQLLRTLPINVTHSCPMSLGILPINVTTQTRITDNVFKYQHKNKNNINTQK